MLEVNRAVAAARAWSTRSLLRAVTACLFAGLVWAAVHALGGPSPDAVIRLVVPLSQGLSTLAAAAAARSPGLTVDGRRFWRQITASMGLLTAGYTGLTWSRLRPDNGSAQALLTWTAPVLLLVVLITLYALLRLPVRTRSRAAWLRLGLDGLTVLVTTALFLWHFAVRPVKLHDVHLDLEKMVLGFACLVTIVAVLKVVLLGTGPVDGRSMQLLAATVLVGSLSSVLAPLIAQPRWVGLHPAMTLIESLLVALAAHVQRRARPGDGSAELLPYLAVGANSILLTITAYRHDSDVSVVSTATIVVSALVVLRQLIALRDNRQLLASVRRHEQRLQHEVTHDALTGLANRTSCTELLAGFMATDRPAGVLLIDLDDFKLVNDTHGHPIGDEVLVIVARRLVEAVRAGDVVCRLGGDEFAVLLHDATAEPATAAAQRIRDALTVPIRAYDHDLLLRASVGVAVAAPGEQPDTVLRNADLAMYAAKDRGKDGHVVYEPGMTTRMVAHAELGAQLRDAIDNDQLFLQYQPIVELDGGRITGTEALVRWHHPRRGIVAPVEFIPAAEQTGLIVPLGRWVLRTACVQQAAWLREHGSQAPQSVSVNVAGRQLTDPAFVDDVLSALRDAGLDPRYLTIEVTETSALDDDTALAALHALRAQRIRLALDDFGTAASSLGLLLTCPVTTLKLDRSFVENITTVARQEAVATAVIRMAQALDLITVAEGIETPEQARMLYSLGYTLGQGYLFDRPLAPDELAGRLTAVRAERNRALKVVS